MKPIRSVVAGTLALLGASTGASPPAEAMLPMQLTSTRFTDGGPIPSDYTCDGRDVSPPLAWSDVPIDTKGFALVDDPDAPKGVLLHWMVYNLPAPTRGLAEAITPEGLPNGAAEGTNDMGGVGYAGPCPPRGLHHYHFKLYALDGPLAGLSSPSKADLERAMARHVLAQAVLVGVYQKSQKQK
jgi:Raf kinase inhibitor-like YbhB/YbcL family protein